MVSNKLKTNVLDQFPTFASVHNTYSPSCTLLIILTLHTHTHTHTHTYTHIHIHTHTHTHINTVCNHRDHYKG